MADKAELDGLAGLRWDERPYASMVLDAFVAPGTVVQAAVSRSEGHPHAVLRIGTLPATVSLFVRRTADVSRLIEALSGVRDELADAELVAQPRLPLAVEG